MKISPKVVFKELLGDEEFRKSCEESDKQRRAADFRAACQRFFIDSCLSDCIAFLPRQINPPNHPHYRFTVCACECGKEARWTSEHECL